MRHRHTVAGIAFVAVLVLLPVSSALAQENAGAITNAQAAHQLALRQIFNDKAGFVAALVTRWEDAAKQGGRWDENYTTDMTAALMKLLPENLAAVAEASSFPEVMQMLAAGSRGLSRDEFGQVIPNTLGSYTSDLVYAPITPCRIVDTRFAGAGPIVGGTRTFDADNTTSFASQGGNAGPCGVPYGVSYAIAATITVTNTSGFGWITAWGLGTMPLSSVVNYGTNSTLANTTTLPIVPGAGNDFSIYSSASADVIIDVVGYFAPPVATALDCTYATAVFGTGTGNVANNTEYYLSDPGACPTGYTLTSVACQYSGTSPAGLALTQIGFGSSATGWLACIWRNQTGLTLNGSTFSTQSRCCRVPGR